jgi:hypothetical protein
MRRRGARQPTHLPPTEHDLRRRFEQTISRLGSGELRDVLQRSLAASASRCLAAVFEGSLRVLARAS